MRDIADRDIESDRPSATRYKGLGPDTGTETDTEAVATPSNAMLARREALMAAIRLSRAVGSDDLGTEGAVIDVPRAIVVGNEVHDIVTSMRPGVHHAG